MAEREGFEPSVVLLLHTLSKRADKKSLTGLNKEYINFGVKFSQ